MGFWRENVDRIIEFNDRRLLSAHGSISNAQLEEMVKKIYEKYDNNRKNQEAQEADYEDLLELENLEEALKHRKD